MELSSLIRALSDPAAYPESTGPIDVRQTHISVVFLTNGCAYKIKKPVSLGFVDFSTISKRRHACDEELRLNRRLAPDVYLDVVPIRQSRAGVRVEGDGQLVEWAVKMRRLPDEATLEYRVLHENVPAGTVESLARTLAAFHRGADRGERISKFGRFDVVARNARENFEDSHDHVELTVSRAVFDRLQALSEAELARQQELIEARASRGVPCDTHGDLRLEHVYLLDDRKPPHDLAILDCVEFNERFRFGDPVADLAFLVMDLKRIARSNLARALAETYFTASGDHEGRALLPLYTAYRALVRAKVEGIKLTEQEVAPAERAASATKARSYWLAALGELEEPAQKPCLLVVAGLPGTGKSTLAAELGAQAGFSLIRSDVVRRELAGHLADGPSNPGFEQGIYAPQWTERTYAECLRRAETLLWEGRRAVVDANFRHETHRRRFLEAACRLGVPAILLVCETEPQVVRQRLAERKGDVSQADWAIYLQARQAWDTPGPLTSKAQRTVATDQSRDETLQQALTILRQAGVYA